MAKKIKYNFGDGDRDSVVKEMIRHDNSHMGPGLVDKRRVKYWSELIPKRGVRYWSDSALPPQSGVGTITAGNYQHIGLMFIQK